MAKKWLVYFQRYVALLLNRLFFLIFYGKGSAIPPIQNNASILKCSATELARRIRCQEITSRTVLKAFIARIAEINPLVNCAVDQRYEAALLEADAADVLVASGTTTREQLERELPLLGVPFSVKDSLAVRGMTQSAGLLARRNIRPEADSAAVTLMRQTGAIPFALSNVSECCMWWESNNPLHGRTRNPNDAHRTAGGSGGGEACLNSAGGTTFGIGADMGGSILLPSLFNGVFGHKTTGGLISMDGMWPRPPDVLQHMVSVGPFCRYACDLPPIVAALAGERRHLLRLDEPVDVRRVRVFYQLGDGGGDYVSPLDEDMADAVRRVAQHFASVCAVQPERVQLRRLLRSTQIFFGSKKAPPGSETLESRLLNSREPGARIDMCWELCKLLVGRSRHTLSLLIMLLSARWFKGSGSYGTGSHARSMQERDALMAEMGEMLGDDGVFVYPTHPTVAPFHQETIVRAYNFTYTAIMAVMGLPSTAVPMGSGSEGLPLGVQVIANHNQDRLCLAVAAELERAFGGWRDPGGEVELENETNGDPVMQNEYNLLCRMVDQLRREAAIQRMAISQAVTDIIEYISEHEKNDHLLVGFSSRKVNPFSKKSFCEVM